MTFENRLPANYAFGTLTSAAAISDTTLTSTDFGTYLASGLSTTNYVPMTLQDASTHNFEIVWVSAHTAAASTCTVVRGKEGTSARAWGSGTLWTISPTLRDGVLPVTTRTALPSDPHVGLRAFIQDEQVVVQYILGLGWVAASSVAYRASTLLGADAGSVVFSAIPSTLKKVQVVWQARGTQGVVNIDLVLRVNADSSANYFTNLHTQQNATITPSASSGGTSATVGAMPGSTAAANDFASGEISIPGWNQPGSRTAVNGHWRSHMWDSAANSFLSIGAFLYNVNGPYTSLTLLPAAGNIKAGSEFTVYGWA